MIKCRRRQDDARTKKNTAQEVGIATTIGIGIGGIVLSVGVGIFTGGIGMLICLPITTGATAAAAGATTVLVDQCAEAENSFMSLHLQLTHRAMDISQLHNSLSII